MTKMGLENNGSGDKMGHQQGYVALIKHMVGIVGSCQRHGIFE